MKRPDAENGDSFIFVPWLFPGSGALADTNRCGSNAWNIAAAACQRYIE
jgi:hypothetical protein